jgi:hypothetical protein
MNAFNDLEKIPRGNSVKYISKAKTSEGNPVVEVYNDGDALVLGFIRTTGEYKLDDLMKQFFCYAKKKGKAKVKLDDDALFSGKNDNSCEFRALIYRVFLNKPGIYEKYGFKPEEDVTELRKEIYDYTIKEARNELIPLANLISYKNDSKKFIELVTASGINEEKLFGEYITNLKCDDMRFMINKLGELSGKIEKEHKDNKFLRALYRYQKLHQNLVRIPSCNVGGSLVRYRARSTQRAKKYRRNSRTHKCYYKRTSKKYRIN